MKQVKKWGATLAAAFLVFGASAQTMDEVNAKMKAASELVNARSYVAAIPALEEVIQMGQTTGADASEIVGIAQGLLPKVYYQKGVSEVQAGKLTEAITSLDQAAAKAELQGDATTQRQAGGLASKIYMQQGVNSFNAKEFDKALESFNQGYERDPNNAQLAYFMAKSYAEKGDLTRAVTLYQQVIAAGAANTRYAKEAADAQKDMNTYILVAASEAATAGNMEALSSYAEMIPNSPEAGLMVVQAANNRRNYDIVIARGSQAYEAQIDATKKSEVAYLLGVAYQNKSNNPKATEWLRKVTAGSNVAAAKALLTTVNQ